ncbi:MAG TPA: hypothetical protein VN680_11975 [Burkholderiaceae bacterium]|nr:hypothetical protein [Burkholderiaceae bacterium]
MKIAPRRVLPPAALLMAGLLHGTPAQAQEGLIAPGTETWKFGLGGVLNEGSTRLRLDSPSGRSGEVNLEDVTGLDRNKSSIFVLATWRFAANHRIGIQGFEVKRDADKVIERDIEFRDQVIHAGTRLHTEAKTDFFVVNYQYSFIRNESLEFAGIAGLYGAHFKFGFNASNPPTDVQASTNAPLPMLGLGLDWFVTPRWTVSLLGEGLAVKVGDVDGRTYNGALTTDYMVTRNIGLGLGLAAVNLKVDVTKNDFTGRVGWRMSSFFGYLQARF